MLTFIKLKNFKSLKNVHIDLTDRQGNPKKAVFIYGENGSGKTNLITSIEFLTRTFTTLVFAPQRNEINNLFKEYNDKKPDQYVKILLDKLHYTISPLSELIDENITIDCNEPMEIYIGFKDQVKDDYFNGEYYCKFFNNEIIYEELKCKCRIVDKLTSVFKIKENIIKLSPTFFKSVQYRDNLYNLIAKYWGKNTFMAILYNETATLNSKFFAEETNVFLSYILLMFENTDIYNKYNDYSIKLSFQNTLKHLSNGEVKLKDYEKIKTTENILNLFFTSSYTDIKKVFYKTEINNNTVKYNLFFKKQIGGELLDISANNESTGTITLLNILPYMLSSVLGGTVILDEIDSGVHDLLMLEIVNYLVPMIKGQLIATTHNTLLMENIDFRSIYVFKLDANGNKEITCLGDIANGKRIQKNNNVRQQYLKGNFDGIPYVGYINFEEMANYITKNKEG